MKVVALQEKDRETLKALARERDECLRRASEARRAYDGLLLALAKEHMASPTDNSYRLDDTENFLVVGRAGEWRGV